ncbi:MAG TPA: histidine phosphatase family protein [Arenibaculum sp.]|nr:histidine phosphatase family protein [Arenibaculum sp.]
MQRILGAAFAALLVAASPRPGTAQDALPDETAGLVVVMRHALAPGTGDPPGFRIEDCATQRNLDEGGRRQARAIGARLREAGLQGARVLSSQWCRSLETSELLDLGPVEEAPMLNSFFGRPEEERPNMEALGSFLAGLDGQSAPVVLVTHQVTVTALTGIFPASGEAVLLRADGTRDPEPIGRMAIDAPPR